MNKRAIIILIGLAVLLVVSGILVTIFSGATEEGRDIERIYRAQQEANLSAEGQEIKQELIASLEGSAGTIFSTTDFEIGYLSPPMERFMIFVPLSGYQQKADTAIKWLKSRGFSESDICNLPTVISVYTNTPSENTQIPANHLPSFCNGAE